MSKTSRKNEKFSLKKKIGASCDTKSRNNWTKKLTFDFQETVIPNSCTGANTMYNTRKGNSYFLFDVANENHLTIHTNNLHFRSIKEFFYGITLV